MENGKNVEDERWTRSIAVGSGGFVDWVKSILGTVALGRKKMGAAESYQLRGPSAFHIAGFGAIKDDIVVSRPEGA
ncbi:MAG: hypothetical protein R6V46_15780 [Desulfatiglandaceae bacterium]